MKRIATIVMSTLLILSVLSIAPVTQAGEVGDEGMDRWVDLGDLSGTNYTTNANITLPEKISENHTLDGELTHNITDPADADIATTNWVNITFTNDTGEEWTFQKENITVDSNETVEFTIDTNLPEGEYTVHLSFENDDGGSNQVYTNEDGDDIVVTVISNSQWVIVGIMNPLVTVFVTFMIAMLLIKSVAKVFGDVGEEV